MCGTVKIQVQPAAAARSCPPARMISACRPSLHALKGCTAVDSAPRAQWPPACVNRFLHDVALQVPMSRHAVPCCALPRPAECRPAQDEAGRKEGEEVVARRAASPEWQAAAAGRAWAMARQSWRDQVGTSLGTTLGSQTGALAGANTDRPALQTDRPGRGLHVVQLASEVCPLARSALPVSIALAPLLDSTAVMPPQDPRLQAGSMK